MNNYKQDTIQKYFHVLNEFSIVSITNLKGEIKYVNNKFSEISKYSKDELLGAPHRIVNSGYHDRDFFKRMWSTIGKGHIWQGNVRNKNKHGDYYWVFTTIVPIKEAGKITEYFSVRVEITEQKKQEKKTKLEQKRYRQLFDHIHDGVMVLDKDMRVLDVNNAALQMDQLTKEDVLGKDIRASFPELDKSGFTAIFQKAIREGFAHYPMLKYGDDEKSFWRKGKLYVLPSGEIVCVYADITDEIKQMEQIHEYNQRLEQIAFTASHEIRAPVASILGLFQLIDQSELNDSNKEIFSHLQKSVFKLDQIIHEIVEKTYDEKEGVRLFEKLAEMKKSKILLN